MSFLRTSDISAGVRYLLYGVAPVRERPASSYGPLGGFLFFEKYLETLPFCLRFAKSPLLTFDQAGIILGKYCTVLGSTTLRLGLHYIQYRPAPPQARAIYLLVTVIRPTPTFNKANAGGPLVHSQLVTAGDHNREARHSRVAAETFLTLKPAQGVSVPLAIMKGRSKGLKIL